MMEAAEAMFLSTASKVGAAVQEDVEPDRRGRLLHGYLHKTSNSLCGIKGYASLIATDIVPHPKTRRWAKKILAEVEMMERIYRSVQEIAFPQRCELEESDLDATVERAIANTKCWHPHLEIETSVQVSGRLLLPAKDLELIVSELLQNSVEGADGEPCGARNISLRTSADTNEQIFLTVQDDGPGMPRELLPQAVNPFVTTKEGHLGIGLARVDTVMDMYSLAWSLHSRPRFGTTVVLEVAVSEGLA